MELDLEREIVAHQLWEGADLPEPLNKEGVKLDWVKNYKKLSNVWVRGFWDGKHLQLFKIKWRAKCADIVSAGLM
jgi:hypothetical protein